MQSAILELTIYYKDYSAIDQLVGYHHCTYMFFFDLGKRLNERKMVKHQQNTSVTQARHRRKTFSLKVAFPNDTLRYTGVLLMMSHIAYPSGDPFQQGCLESINLCVKSVLELKKPDRGLRFPDSLTCYMTEPASIAELNNWLRLIWHTDNMNSTLTHWDVVWLYIYLYAIIHQSWDHVITVEVIHLWHPLNFRLSRISVGLIVCIL